MMKIARKNNKRIVSCLMAAMLAFTALITAPPTFNRVTAADEAILRVQFYASDGNYAPKGFEYSLWYWVDGIISGRLARYKVDGGNAVTSEEFKKGDNGARIFEVVLPDKAVAAIKSGKKLGMVFPQVNASGTANWSTKDIGSDRFVVPEFDSNNVANVYVFRGDKTVYSALSDALNAFEQIQTAQFSDKNQELNHGRFVGSFNTVRFSLTTPLSETPDLRVSLWANDENGESRAIQENVLPDRISGEPYSGYVTFNAVNEANFDFTAQYQLAATGYNRRATIDMTKLLTTDKFKNSFTYEGDDLGADYSLEETNFRMWSPLAKRVQINFYYTGDIEDTVRWAPTVEMERAEKGTWYYSYKGFDLANVYYTYTVYIYDDINEIVDLYAKTTGANGERGMILDIEATNPAGWENDKPLYISDDPAHKLAVESPVIWEVHVRDFSIHPDSGMKHKGKFIAFTEEDTTLRGDNSVKTGINYLKDLGITYVHLLPSYDHAKVGEHNMNNIAYEGKFNWGYDPKNYNAPEGSYSTDPSRGEVRVNEFKQMVQALHNAGIGVIMDVVYNHTSASSGSYFDLSMPGYYYRQHYSSLVPYGTFADGSGCGNETASERSMVNKYMRDSLQYWLTEYHLDGFRFDLMALHDRGTMNDIRRDMDAHENGEKILIYGEPWQAGGSPLVETTDRGAMYQVPGVGAFTDVIRKGIKGEDSGFDGGRVEPGYISGNTSFSHTLREAVQGKSYDGFNVNNPAQMINYASAHDNHTLYDHVNKVYNGWKTSAMTYIKRNEAIVQANKLAAGIYLMAKGIPFIHAGEEIARTKLGNHNSYNSPDHINQIDWARAANYQDMFEYYKGLIEIRKRFSNLRDVTGFRNEQGVNHGGSYDNFRAINTGDDVVGYAVYNYANDSSGWKYLVIIHNPYDADLTGYGVSLQSAFGGTGVAAFAGGNLYRLTNEDGTINLNNSTLAHAGATVTLKAKSTNVFVQKA